MIIHGAWAGRLGNGLQNRVGRFDSARHLVKSSPFRGAFFVPCFGLGKKISLGEIP